MISAKITLNRTIKASSGSGVKGKNMEMTFEALVQKINPKIKAIANRLDGKYTSFSDDDLYQESLLRLWQKFNESKLEDKTESYIVQGCSFDMRNYIRTHFKGVDRRSVSAYTPINEQGNLLIDILPEKEADNREEVYDTAMTLEDISRKLSDREKIVLEKSSAGLTTREIGEYIGTSHVMVVKIKKKIRDKCLKLGVKNK
ncbi:MAG: sigma-70 family RNA polymerase sigma factor [Candidatus Omnitrophica bacterium]|nr:sigma-70 family RNA polymerase sigma factor [Candidatus Omnitrophota bacterium]